MRSTLAAFVLVAATACDGTRHSRPSGADLGPAAPDARADAAPPVDATPEPRAPRLILAADTPRAEVDPRFLSVAIDASQAFGGVWWPPDAEAGGALGDRRVDPFDFGRPKLRKLARALAPAVLRIGGSEADRVYYDLSDAPVDEAPAPYELVMTRALWEGIHDFAADVGYDVFFTLNAGPGPRDAEGRWTPDQARALLEYVRDRGQTVVAWELGNEINGFPVIHGFRLSPAQYAEDVATARALVDAVTPGVPLAGPSSAFWPVTGELAAIYPRFMAAGGHLLDIITWHYYPQQSRRCPIASRRAGPEVLLDPAALDEAARWAAHVEAERDAHAPDAPVWLGETGNAQCGGEPGVSDAFAGSLWWVDQLGLVAARGQPIVVRQTLAGSNYGLLHEETLDPQPDYWASLLWKRLMGPRVLAAEIEDQPPTLRLYAHCTPDRPGAVTVAAVNLDRTRPARFAPASHSRHEAYVVTAPTLAAREVSLDDTPLRAAPDGTLPALEPIMTDAPATVPPLAYAFFVYPDADAPACR